MTVPTNCEKLYLDRMRYSLRVRVERSRVWQALSVSGRRSREAGTQQAVSVAHVDVPRNPSNSRRPPKPELPLFPLRS